MPKKQRKPRKPKTFDAKVTIRFPTPEEQKRQDELSSEYLRGWCNGGIVAIEEAARLVVQGNRKSTPERTSGLCDLIEALAKRVRNQATRYRE